MHQARLLEGGEYVIVSVEEEDTYDRRNKYQYMKKDWEDSSIVSPFPFRAVLLLSPRVPSDEHYGRFSEDVLSYAGTQPLCIPMHTELKFKASLAAKDLFFHTFVKSQQRGPFYALLRVWAMPYSYPLSGNGARICFNVHKIPMQALRR
ncbi:hypothetical protein HPB48_010445 [Haemaphysalis longicornis]|uniref:Uncharacterized protein n=1 Tax=Haemaphysalis longicornis TaxID=44386 RepID=A0A9J6FRY6_HAELO|nr:hypothetical protein HPB48_010445 [Haemaphysalis longicornis]